MCTVHHKGLAEQQAQHYHVSVSLGRLRTMVGITLGIAPLLAIMALQTWTMMDPMDRTLNNFHHHRHTHLHHLSLFHHQYHPPCLSFLHLPQMCWVMYLLLAWLILKHLHLAHLLLTQPLLHRCRLHPNANSPHSMPRSLILRAARNNILQWVPLP